MPIFAGLGGGRRQLGVEARGHRLSTRVGIDRLGAGIRCDLMRDSLMVRHAAFLLHHGFLAAPVG